MKSNLRKNLDEFIRLATDKEYAKKVAEKAYQRKEYINKIESVVVGAAIEYFKCKLVDKLNIKHQDRSHWEKEWRYHLGEKMQYEVLHTITFSNRRKALNVVLLEINADTSRFMTVAANTIAKYVGDSKSKMQKVLDKNDADSFMEELEKSFTSILDKLKMKNRN